MTRRMTLLALRLFARSLPAPTREKVFEPAYADLVLDDLEGRTPAGSGTLRLLSASAVVAAESFRVGLPVYLWRDGRLTRLGKAVAVVVIGGGALLLLITRIGYGPA